MKWRKSYTLVLVAVVVLSSAAAWYVWGPRETPAGQPGLADLTVENLPAFQKQFNDDADKVRLVVLLSPT